MDVVSRAELLPYELEAADDRVSCRLERAEYEVLYSAVERRLIGAATGGAIMAEEHVQDCLTFLKMEEGSIEMVGFALSDEFAELCAESLEESAAFLEDEETRVAYALARLMREQLGA